MEIYTNVIYRNYRKKITEAPTHHKKAQRSWADIKFSGSFSSVNLDFIKAKFTQKQLWKVWHSSDKASGLVNIWLSADKTSSYHIGFLTQAWIDLNGSNSSC